MIKKNVFLILGIIFLILGTIGIVIPLIPTTPFYLLSGYLFGKSSEKFYNFLINNRVCGRYLKDYQEKRGITIKNKINALIFLSLSIGFSMTRIESEHFKIFLMIIFIGVAWHILSIRTIK